MDKQEKELTAHCGLYCGDCIRYRSKAADLAKELLGELEDTEFSKYADIKSSAVNQSDQVSELKYYSECREILEALAALQCRTPCRAGGGCPSFSCNIMECSKIHGFSGCWECNDFENCKNFEVLEPFHGDTPVQNLRIIRESGLEGWSAYRKKCYIWQ
jgi:hypothetical protein